MRLDIHIQLIPVRHFLEHFADLFVSGKGIRGQYSTGPIAKKKIQLQKKEWRLVCLTPAAHQLRRFGGLRRKLCSIVHPSSPLRIWQSF